jgi:DHA1 family bicyclomycin/chloramphenicol resistance-like MFS transporter
MVFAIPVGLAFDGTPLPLAIGILAMIAASQALMIWLRRIEARHLV